MWSSTQLSHASSTALLASALLKASWPQNPLYRLKPGIAAYSFSIHNTYQENAKLC